MRVPFLDLQAVHGLRFTYEPTHLRFFQARFEPLVGSNIFAPPTSEVLT